MAEIMNRNYRSRNLSSTVLKLPKYFHLTKFSLCVWGTQKKVDKRSNIIKFSFRLWFWSKMVLASSREKTVKIAYFSWQTNPTIISKIALFCTLRCSSISIFEFFTLFLLHWITIFPSYLLLPSRENVNVRNNKDKSGR